MSIKETLDITFRIVLGLVLLVSGLAKAFSLRHSSRDIEESLPPKLSAWTPLLIGLLCILEVSLGTLILTTYSRPALLISASLFAAFLVFVTYRIQQNDRGRCNCFGSVVPSSYSWSVVVRNAIFVVLALGSVFFLGQTENSFALGNSLEPNSLLTIIATFSLASVAFVGMVGQIDTGGSHTDSVESQEASRGFLLPNALLTGSRIESSTLASLLDTNTKFEDRSRIVLLFLGKHCAPCESLVSSLESKRSQLEALINVQVLYNSNGGMPDKNELPWKPRTIADESLQTIGISGSPSAMVISAAGEVLREAELGTDSVLHLVLDEAARARRVRSSR